MKTRALFFVVAGLLSVIKAAPAYEIETHAEMSKRAAQSSVLSSPDLLRSLGLNFPIDSEQQKFPNSKNQSQTILDVLQDGSRFEDTLFKIPPRPLNHFFDPIYNRPLTVLGVAAGEKSPDWALEDISTIGGQDYSYRDARNYFYQALTATNEDVRKTSFGLTFQTLGHVIHHLQDMAQPQHVRNDPHCDAFYCVGPLYNPSRYEKYTDDHRGELVYNGTPVSFLNPRSFWTTGDGKGLAEFTNRNFVSAGTNFDNKSGRYASPALDPNSAWEADIRRPDLFPAANMPIPSQCQDDANPCYMTFYRNTVVDSYRPTETKVNDKTSTWSIFDQDLKTYNTTFTRTDPDTGQTYTTNSAFSLNRFNFDETHKFLIPRAVAYSTGLLDYFFRGKLETQDAGFTDTGISLRVRNAIDPKTAPAWKDETPQDSQRAANTRSLS